MLEKRIEALENLCIREFESINRKFAVLEKRLASSKKKAGNSEGQIARFLSEVIEGAQYVEPNVVIFEDSRRKWMEKETVKALYGAWCERQGEVPISMAGNGVGRQLRLNGIEKRTNNGKTQYYFGEVKKEKWIKAIVSKTETDWDLDRFFKDAFDESVTSSERLTTRSVYSLYQTWCKRRKQKDITRLALARRLKKKGFDLEREGDNYVYVNLPALREEQWVVEAMSDYFARDSRVAQMKRKAEKLLQKPVKPDELSKTELKVEEFNRLEIERQAREAQEEMECSKESR